MPYRYPHRPVRRRLVPATKHRSSRGRTVGRAPRRVIRRKYVKKRVSYLKNRRVRRRKRAAIASALLAKTRVYECVFRTYSDVSNYRDGRYINRVFNLSDPWSPMSDNSPERPAEGLEKMRGDGYNQCVVAALSYGRTRTRTRTCTHIRTHTRTHARSYTGLVRTLVRTPVRNAHSYAHSYAHLYAHSQGLQLAVRGEWTPIMMKRKLRVVCEERFPEFA